MQFYLLKETFGYLDSRNSTKLNRVSTSWRGILKTTVTANKGVILLDWRTSNVAETRKDHALIALESWMSVFRRKFIDIKHLVSIGRTTVFEDFHEYEHLFSFPHSWSKVTFYDDLFTDESLCDIANFLLNASDSVELRHCAIRAEQLCVNFERRRYRHDWANVNMEGFNWKMEVNVPHMVFDQTFKGKEAPRRWPQRWLLEQFDEMNLIWPYGADQLEWLKKSLAGLKGETLKAVRFEDEEYFEWHPDFEFDGGQKLLKLMDIKSAATSDGRELDTLDCAFFGRLLVRMNEAMKKRGRVPMFEPPPHAFSDDFEVYEY